MLGFFRCIIGPLSLVLVAGAASAQAPSVSSGAGPNEALVLEVLESFDSIQRGDFRGAESALTDLTESPDFSGLADTLQREVYILLSRAITARRGRSASFEVARRITELAAAQPADWISRMETAFGWERDLEDGTYSLTQLLRGWPEQINGLNPGYVAARATDARFELEDSAIYLALIDALIDSEWNVPTNYVAIDRVWIQLVLQLIEQGEDDRAIAAARHVRYVPAVIAMLADRRFDAIRSTSPDWFTLESATEREFDIRRQNVSNIPAQLSVTNAWIDALRRANRVNEAIDVIGSAAQPGPHADPNSLTGWTDEINSLRWFMNQRADLLWQIGELQDAKAQLQEARVTFAAEGRTHVDQTINLARYYARSGQSGRAVEAVDGLDNLSTYGEMIVRYVRLMAAVADGSQEGIWRQIEFMERNRDDSLFLYQRALIMAGRLDEAAEFLIERLAGDVTRVGALVEMQTYLDDQPSAILAPLDIRYAEQKRQLLEREDVRAAIEPVGRVQAYPVWFAGFEIFDLADD